MIQEDKDILTEAYIDVVQRSQLPDWTIAAVGNNNHTLDLEEAIQYFNQPVDIILENSLNDRYFLNAIIKNLDKDKSKKISKHIENRWVIISNAGGATNIKNCIEEKKQSFDSLAQTKNRGKSFYLRLFVLVDSDRKYISNSQPGKQTKERDILAEYLKNEMISFHFLFKREMENYIPNEVLEDFKSMDTFIECYLNLSEDQKDFFDLQKGFINNKTDKSLDEDFRSFYGSVSDKDWKILKNGIQLEPYAKSFKSEFPKLFEHEKVTQETLLTRTKHQQQQSNELQEILDKIRKLL
ncbi:MAG TPA: hypothetical protein PK453_21620 [Leptospiraceae bacterium]|nr:hypothetical protein [Leptospiraceae bacterium]HNF23477.1 hypothetical protein [Leptospiraceae bacterium]HNI96848.1 hypothetical protein [Leptospiraceae bacterium]HNM01608.1 hypothetical protein [Leptospiraceae bacterium]HNN06989.1 hypothetical protein [Leptospiraceae bacterium]